MYSKLRTFKPTINITFSNKNLAQLFENCPSKFVKRNTLLYDTGEKADTIYLIKKGIFKLFLSYPDGNIKTIDYHTRGTTLGELNCFAYSQAICSCEAVTDSIVLMCPFELYLERLRKYDLFEESLRLNAIKGCYMFDSIEVMFAKDRKELVANLLDEGMAQHEIADFTGYSKVHISRICSQLNINKSFQEIYK